MDNSDNLLQLSNDMVGVDNPRRLDYEKSIDGNIQQKGDCVNE